MLVITIIHSITFVVATSVASGPEATEVATTNRLSRHLLLLKLAAGLFDCVEGQQRAIAAR
ncbi:MAG: hypothetical protein KDH90_05720, partial [Anaerolineae bacterium]|nr:hypothetical protein [Anaerolineae bacterium]